MTNIVRLVPDTASADFRIEADQLLEDAKGRSWHRLAIIGQSDDPDDDTIYITGNANVGEMLILMELAKREIIP